MRFKIVSLFLLLFVSAFAVETFSQQAQVLATANGFTFRTTDISAEGKQLFDQQQRLIADDRRAAFDEWIFEELLKMEAKARNITAEKIQAEAVANAAKPTDVQIKAVYDGNRQSLGNRTLEEVRPNIIEYLNRDAAGKQLIALFESLKTKYGYRSVNDVGTSLKATDGAATIGTRQITVGEFEQANRIAIYNYRASIDEQIRLDLENTIFNKLVEAEAKKRNIDAGSLIAAEITNKLKDYSNYERMYLEDMLQEKLFRDYAVKFATPPIEPQVLMVSTDDDPSIGPATAKVTIVAFVDFQCSACSAFSPLMKQVIGEFGQSVRLVVRDYPLTEIHDHAMDSALAGFAARQQGKFFEMGDLMYRNQDALDSDSLAKYAASLGMDAAKFESDRHSAAASAEIKKDIAGGEACGVSGTPTVFVNGERLQRLSTSRLRSMIRDALK
jgi:protein-disulfide isomerase